MTNLVRLLLITALFTIGFCEEGQQEEVPAPGPIVPTPAPSLKAIQTSSSMYHGEFSNIVGPAVATYRGIRYAQAPIGDLRWKQPQDYTPEDHTMATEFGKSCLQSFDDLNLISMEDQDEDCLTLNIFRENDNPTDSKSAVIVFFHGGFWNFGGSSLFEADKLVLGNNVVAVTVNYRLGVFGYFVNDHLKEESDLNTSGNYGLLDKIKALEWIHENIEAFGGDPERVTIWGHSAGSVDVSLLMISPMSKSKNLFHRVFVESGSALIGPNGKPSSALMFSLDGNKAVSDKVVKALDCNGVDDILECLRTLDAAEIITASEEALIPCPSTSLLECTDTTEEFFTEHGGFLTPVVDNVVVPEDPVTLFRGGRFEDVDILFGTVTNEGSIFIPDISSVTREQFEATTNRLFGNISQVLDFYLDADFDFNGEGDRLAQVLGDFYLTSSTRRVGELSMESGSKKNIFAYVWDHNPSFTDPSLTGAFHGSDVLFWLGNVPDISTQGEKELALQMAFFLTSFAKDGKVDICVGGQCQDDWPEFEGENYLQLRENDIQGITNYNKIGSDFWDGVIYGENKCTDDDGVERDSGESWEVECNTCSCDLGAIVCGDKDCNESNNSDSGNTGISTGGIIGILIGVIAVLIAAICIAMYYRKKQDHEEFIPMPESQDEPRSLYRPPPVPLDQVESGQRRGDDGL